MTAARRPLSRFIRGVFVLAGLLLVGGGSRAAEVMPPSPAAYFNDYAGAVPPAVAAQLNRRLAEFEQATSSQVVVAVFPKMQSDSSLEDYTHRLAEAWKVGQKNRNNGVVLFVFMQDRRTRIDVGYGLEGALPDALCKRILEDEIRPRFKAGDYAAGLTAGVEAILKATRGEYKAAGRNSGHDDLSPLITFLVVLFFLMALVFSLFRNILRTILPRGTVYGGHGRQSSSWGVFGGGDGSGGGFSGGGGSFGGGGASGGW
ncbi:MAG: TPM domain-containing protein [Lentisphaeria bacterium]